MARRYLLCRVGRGVGMVGKQRAGGVWVQIEESIVLRANEVVGRGGATAGLLLAVPSTSVRKGWLSVTHPAMPRDCGI